ncbi:hypothetical protein LTR17_011957 [Elasticomyces elasticus]|nr:hypothetical protein LTR17_011957 [Elasticomyces elasticus]
MDPRITYFLLVLIAYLDLEFFGRTLGILIVSSYVPPTTRVQDRQQLAAVMSRTRLLIEDRRVNEFLIFLTSFGWRMRAVWFQLSVYLLISMDLRVVMGIVSAAILVAKGVIAWNCRNMLAGCE